MQCFDVLGTIKSPKNTNHRRTRNPSFSWQLSKMSPNLSPNPSKPGSVSILHLPLLSQISPIWFFSFFFSLAFMFFSSLFLFPNHHLSSGTIYVFRSFNYNWPMSIDCPGCENEIFLGFNNEVWFRMTIPTVVILIIGLFFFFKAVIEGANFSEFFFLFLVLISFNFFSFFFSSFVELSSDSIYFIAFGHLNLATLSFIEVGNSTKNLL